MYLRILREPLVHFLVFGGLLFLLFRLAGDGERGSEELVVSSARIERLARFFEISNQREPTEQELDGLIEDYIREEVLYREAVALGLDDDTVVRRYMRDKMEFVAEDLVAQLEPGEEELAAWFREHAEKYRVEDRFTFRHVYLSPERRGDRLERDAEGILEQLSASDGELEFAALGDPVQLPDSYRRIERSRVEKIFGASFADSLEQAAVGAWTGPIASGYGRHLVQVTERLEGGQPTLDEVREAVFHDWWEDQRKKALDIHYQGLRERYRIRIEKPEGDRL